MKDKIDQLFRESKNLVYDENCGMQMVPVQKGPGFFPGCSGFHNHKSNSAKIDVMVLGQDFDTVTTYEKLTAKGEVDSNTTWRNLRTLLRDIEIDEDSCFFTNVYMGLRIDKRNTGPSPAKKSAPFVGLCENFFKDQLCNIEPELVLVLGREPAQFVGKMFLPGNDVWGKIPPLKEFYRQESNIYRDVEFKNKKIRFLFAIHPSLNNTNRSKIWGKDKGANEITLLRKYVPKAFKKS